MAGDSLGPQALEDCWAWCASFASQINETILLATMNEDLLPVNEFVFSAGMVSHGELVRPVVETEPPVMSSAPFVYRDDGLPDWGAMWGSFCELALFGGPPHRGDDSAIRVGAAPDTNAEQGGFDAVSEIARGIRETTGLEGVAVEPGWLTVACDSPKMAAWLCAAIILENVEARVDGDCLLVPARPDYSLKEEVKSVITVVAKTHHYWLEHAKKDVQTSACRTLSPGAMAKALALHAHPPVTTV
jgi:hypothetical protein